jgi:hypothetical protein
MEASTARRATVVAATGCGRESRKLSDARRRVHQEILNDDDALEELWEAFEARGFTCPSSTHTESQDGWLDSTAAAKYLGISRNALNEHTATRSIPFEQDGPGCKCWFERDQLDAWRMGGAAAKPQPRVDARWSISRNRAHKNPA